MLGCRAVAALAESPEFHLSKKLQPGDIEIVHNPTVFHSRGEVIDGKVSITMLFPFTCLGYCFSSSKARPIVFVCNNC